MPTTPKPVDCSELAATITKIALNLGANPKFNTLDKITVEMQRTLPELSEKQVIDSIAEAALIPNDFISTVSKKEIPQNKALERLVFERNRLRNRINTKISNLKPKGVWGTIAEPLNAARAVMTSFDFSALLRQGGFIVVGHPIRSAKSLDALFLSLSKRQQARIEAEIQARPNAPLYERAGLFIAELGGKLSGQEEVYMSRWAERIPIVAASQRSYTTFLNKLRADSFDAMVQTLAKNQEVTLQEATAIANFVNVATGRGGPRRLEKTGVALNTIFFAPRYVSSRFQLIALQPLWKGTGRTRGLIATEYARYIIGMGIIYALARAAGWDIELDLRSSDFLKIRMGKIRLDPLSGMSQVIVFTSRIISGKRKSTKTKRITRIRGDVSFGQDDAVDVVFDFVRSKFAPVLGSTFDIISGEDVIGGKVTLGSEARELITPLALRDVAEAIEEEGVPKGTAIGLAAIFGIGVEVHKPRKR